MCLCIHQSKKWGDWEYKYLILLTNKFLGRDKNKGSKGKIEEQWRKIQAGMFSHTNMNWSIKFLKRKYIELKKDYKKNKAANKGKKHKASKSGASPPSSPVRPYKTLEIDELLQASSKKDIEYRPRDAKTTTSNESYEVYTLDPNDLISKKPNLTGPYMFHQLPLLLLLYHYDC